MKNKHCTLTNDNDGLLFSLGFDGAMGVLDMEGRVLLAGAAPVEEKLLADDEEHNANLRDREEAPDRRLFLEVLGDVRGEEWASEPQKHALDDHVLLEDKERTEHQERVDGGRRRKVGRIIHRHGPCQMVVALKRAQLLATQPLLSAAAASGRLNLWRPGKNTNNVSHTNASQTKNQSRTGEITIVGRNQLIGPGSEEITRKEHGATKQTETQNDLVLAEKLGILGERAVDDVCEVGLKKNYQSINVRRRNRRWSRLTW